jgi:hypothetical protein
MAQSLEHFEAVDTRKHDIQDDQGKGLSTHHAETQLSRIGGRNRVTFVSCVLRNQLSESDVVVDQQKLCLCRSALD